MTEQTKAQRLVYRVEHTTGFDPYLLLKETADELRRLDANEAALVEALKEISDDYADRFDLDSPSTNPGIKYTIKHARALITRIEAERNAK